VVRLPLGFVTMWALSFCGWLSICTISFGATSAWAERQVAQPGTPEFNVAVKVASSLLMGSTVVFIVAGSALPFLVSMFGGPERALLAAQAALSLSLMSFISAIPSALTGAVLVLLYPVAYQVVANVPFTWLENQPDFPAEQRGRMTGLLNSSIAAAQVVTAISMGPLAAMFGGKLLAAFVGTAVLGGGIATSIAVQFWLLRRRAGGFARAVLNGSLLPIDGTASGAGSGSGGSRRCTGAAPGI